MASSIAAQDGTASLEGILEDPTGARVVNASVILQSETVAGRTFRTQSNPTGLYRFSSLPADHYALLVQQEGFKWWADTSIDLSEALQKQMLAIRLEVRRDLLPVDRNALLEAFEVRLVFPAGDTGNLGGRIVNTGKPAMLGGAQVRLRCDSRVCASTRTAADGTFDFTGIAPGKYGLTVQQEGIYPFTERIVEVHRGLDLFYHPEVEACQTEDCDPKKRVESTHIRL